MLVIMGWRCRSASKELSDTVEDSDSQVQQKPADVHTALAPSPVVALPASPPPGSLPQCPPPPSLLTSHPSSLPIITTSHHPHLPSSHPTSHHPHLPPPLIITTPHHLPSSPPTSHHHHLPPAPIITSSYHHHLPLGGRGRGAARAASECGAQESEEIASDLRARASHQHHPGQGALVSRNQEDW